MKFMINRAYRVRINARVLNVQQRESEALSSIENPRYIPLSLINGNKISDA